MVIKVAGEIGLANDRPSGVISRQNRFREEASTLVSQVSESLLTSDGSRVQQEKNCCCSRTTNG